MKDSRKYDDASWHYGGDFPEDLPEEAGATHIAMFLAWALLRGMAGPEFKDKSLNGKLLALQKRQVTPGQFLMESLDGKFVSFELNDEGNAFATEYYVPQNLYVADYEETLAADLPSLYHIKDSWKNFDAFRPRLDQRYDEWKQGTLPQPKPNE